MPVVLLLAGYGCSKKRSTARSGVFANEKTVPTFGAPAGITESDESVSNTDCLVCHQALVDELISVKHLKHGIGCRHCHGMSDDHMQDEMQMTPPDFLFGRNEVEPFCKTCHTKHEHPEKVQAFFEQWRGRDRPNGRVVAENSTCTDCHGEHNLHQTTTDESEAGVAEWVPLFDGSTLAGWRSVGQATWKVENGTIVGRPGPHGAGGELLSTAKYKDFLLAITYRVEWPAEAGIWGRYQSPEKAWRICILESDNPARYTGSLYGGAGEFLAVNTNKDLVSRDGWNTLSIKARGPRIEVWLNGNSVAVVTDDTATNGKIGFHITSGDEYAKMKLTIREVLLQSIE